MATNEIKYCEDCKWYSAGSVFDAYPKCCHKNAGPDTLVKRGAAGRHCSTMRDFDHLCGSAAKLFEAK